MGIELGKIAFLFRYPVKSMAAERLDAATLGWHGFEGDRRLAFRRLADDGGYPWLTASRLPELLLYQPSSAGPSRNNTVGLGTMELSRATSERQPEIHSSSPTRHWKKNFPADVKVASS